MAEYRDRTFTNGVIELDGNTYTGCTFTDCKIIYRGTAGVTLGVNSFLGNTRFALDGPARRTMDFLAKIYASGGVRVVEAFFDDVRANRFREA